ncbi:MAG TPA: glutathione S-transferase family protein, partial [Streptomyces sp.]|nr:glutathione S-transferase family protein [Streptomyces sp.]
MSATPLPAVPSLPPLPSFRGRIGLDARSGHYAVPRRYRLHLSPSCPDCLQIAITHSLLGL